MPNYKDPRDFKVLKNKELLEKIGMLESSGGRDLTHDPISGGIHEGESALGTYGLMPNTLEEIAKRYPSENNAGLSKEELKARVIEDPEFEKTMAASMASHLKDKRGLSDEEVAAAWEAGHNLPVERIQKKLDTPRARKFRVLNGKK